MTKHRVTRRLLAVALSVLLVLGCVAPAVAATYEMSLIHISEPTRRS